MSLTKPGPAFHWTWKVPLGVACGPEPGLPGSILTGPKLTLPSDCSQLRCRVRSTQAVAAAGQSLRSWAVSTSGVSSAGTYASTACPAPIRAGATYAQAVAGEDAAASGPTSPVSRAAAVPPPADPDAATAAAIAVAATAPAASAGRLSRLLGPPPPAPDRRRRRPGGACPAARAVADGRAESWVVCLPVPFMRSLRPRLVILPCPS